MTNPIVGLTLEAKECLEEICEELGCSEKSLVSKLVIDYYNKKTGLSIGAKLLPKRKYNPSEYKRYSERVKKMTGTKTIEEVAKNMDIDIGMPLSNCRWLITNEGWKLEKRKVIGPKLVIKITLKQFDIIYRGLNKETQTKFNF